MIGAAFLASTASQACKYSIIGAIWMDEGGNSMIFRQIFGTSAYCNAIQR